MSSKNSNTKGPKVSSGGGSSGKAATGTGTTPNAWFSKPSIKSAPPPGFHQNGASNSSRTNISTGKGGSGGGGKPSDTKTTTTTTTSSDHNNKNSSNSSSSSSFTNNNNNMTSSLRERFLHLTLSFVGERVVLTKTDGSVLEGIFHTFTPFKNEPKYVLKAAQGPNIPPGSTVIIAAHHVTMVHCKSVRLAKQQQHQNGNAKDMFATDTQISIADGVSTGNDAAAATAAAAGGGLVAAGTAWTSGGTSNTATPLAPTLSLNSRADALVASNNNNNSSSSNSTAPLKGSIGHWDQFKANEQLFRVKATFDENLYTTELDKSRFTDTERKAAERIAKEIETTQTTNLHLAEERGQQTETDFEMDEEDKYSGVLTENMKQRHEKEAEEKKKKNGANPDKINETEKARSVIPIKGSTATTTTPVGGKKQTKVAQKTAAPAVARTMSQPTTTAKQQPKMNYAAAASKAAPPGFTPPVTTTTTAVTASPERKKNQNKKEIATTTAAPVSKEVLAVELKEEETKEKTKQEESAAVPSDSEEKATTVVAEEGKLSKEGTSVAAVAETPQDSVATAKTEPAAANKETKITAANKEEPPAIAKKSEEPETPVTKDESTVRDELSSETAEEKTEESSAAKASSKLNPGAKSFTFNPGAKSFSPSFTAPAPTPPAPEQPPMVDPATMQAMAHQMPPAPHFIPMGQAGMMPMMNPYPQMQYQRPYPGIEQPGMSVQPRHHQQQTQQPLLQQQHQSQPQQQPSQTVAPDRTASPATAASEDIVSTAGNTTAATVASEPQHPTASQPHPGTVPIQYPPASFYPGAAGAAGMTMRPHTMNAYGHQPIPNYHPNNRAAPYPMYMQPPPPMRATPNAYGGYVTAHHPHQYQHPGHMGHHYGAPGAGASGMMGSNAAGGPVTGGVTSEDDYRGRGRGRGRVDRRKGGNRNGRGNGGRYFNSGGRGPSNYSSGGPQAIPQYQQQQQYQQYHPGVVAHAMATAPSMQQQQQHHQPPHTAAPANDSKTHE